MRNWAIVIFCAMSIGWSYVQRKVEYERGWNDGCLSQMSYRYHSENDEFISIGFREYLRENRIRLPHNKEIIDSIERYYKYKPLIK